MGMGLLRDWQPIAIIGGIGLLALVDCTSRIEHRRDDAA